MKKSTEKLPKTPKKTNGKLVVCRMFSGARCTICGGYFGEGDETCSHGHTIGETYRL